MFYEILKDKSCFWLRKIIGDDKMVKFRIGEKIIDFEERSLKEEKSFSEHTGKELTDYKIEIRLQGTENRDWFEESIKNNLYKLDNNEDIIANYKGQVISSSSSRQSDLYNYTFKLFEKENLDIEKLIIGNLELVTYEYEEKYNDTIEQDRYLSIDAKAEVDYSEFIKLYTSESKYFEVVREGINDNPVDMRFGKVIWSKIEDTEKIKIDFVMVEKIYDDSEGSSLNINQPEVNNLIRESAYKNKLFDILIDYLIDEDILSKTKLKEFEEKVKDSMSEEAFKFVEVNDVDKY